MNKTIIGELQSLIALAEGAREAGDFEELEQLVLLMAPHWHKLCDSVNRVRPNDDNWIFDQMNRSSFHMNVMHPAYRPVVTR